MTSMQSLTFLDEYSRYHSSKDGDDDESEGEE
jgi:hypothetical protein